LENNSVKKRTNINVINAKKTKYKHLITYGKKWWYTVCKTCSFFLRIIIKNYMNIIDHFKKKSNKDIFKYLLIFASLNMITLGITILLPLESSQYQGLSNYILIYMQFILMILPFKILGTPKESLNLNKGSLKKSIKYTIYGYFIFIFINVLLVQTGLIEILPGFGQQENIVESLIKNNLDKIIIGFAICIIAPIVEEITFRGFIYNKFKDNYGKVLSSVLTSVIFAAIHFQFQVISAMIVLSLIIHWVYEKSGGLNGAITFHVINNTITFIIMSNL